MQNLSLRSVGGCRQGLGKALLLGAALVLSGGALGEAGADFPVPRFEIGGFGTLGVAASDSNDVEFTRDQTQPTGIRSSPSGKLDSLLGVQAYFRATERLELASQAISRYGPQGNFRPEFTWAFAKYSFAPNLSVRAGRLGTEFFMLADSRHVGYSYLTVRPPVDFYGLLAFHYVDGADLSASLPLADGVLKAKGFVGRGNEVAPIGDEFLSLRGNPMAGIYLDYLHGHWQWRASYAQMTFRHELPAPVADLRSGLAQAALLGFPGAAEAASRLSLRDSTSRFYSLGAVYDRGPLLVQGMLGAIHHDSSIYQNSRAAYLIAGYRLGTVTPFAAYSSTRSTARGLSSGLPNLPVFAALNAGLAGAQARVHTDQQTWSLGARWDFQRNMALKGQVDFIRGKPESIFLYPSHTADFDGKLRVFSVNLDFVF